MNQIAKTVFTEFSSLPTLSKNFLFLTKNLDKKILNFCNFELERNYITNFINFNLYQDNTITPKTYEIQSHILMKDYNQKIVLDEYCCFLSCKTSKKDYINYILRIEDKVKYNDMKYINETTLKPSMTINCNYELNNILEYPHINIPLKNKIQVKNIIDRLFVN